MDIINGTHNYQQTDFQTYGQVPIDWAWLWSSNHGTTGSLGNRIHFSYDTQLIVDRQYGELRYRGPNGNELVFPWIFEGEESLDPVNRLFLTAGAHSYKMEDLNTGLTYLYVRSRQNRACYLLSEIRNAAGFALTIQRNEQEQILQLLDSNQFLVNIRYNAQGFIQSLSTEEERIVSYHYSAEGNLIEVIDALNNVQKFIYDTNHLIEQLRQSDGIKRHWRYDSYGRLVHQWTDGHLDEYWFEYDEAQQRNRKRDYYGNETEYDYNEFGLIDRIKHYQGGTERFFYNEQFQLIEQRL